MTLLKNHIQANDRQYFRHTPKTNCQFCKSCSRVNRRIVRDPAFCIEAGQGNFEFMAEQTTCGYHATANWLKDHPEVVVTTTD